MKKLFTVLLALAIVLGFSMSLVACSSNTSSQSSEEMYAEEGKGSNEGADKQEQDNREKDKEEKETEADMPSAEELMAWKNFKGAVDLNGYEDLIYHTISILGVENGTIESIRFAINEGRPDDPEIGFALTIIPKGDVNASALKGLAQYLKENYGIVEGDGVLYVDNDSSIGVEGTTKDYSMYYMAIYDKQRKVVVIHLKKKVELNTPFGLHLEKIQGEQWSYVAKLAEDAGVDGTKSTGLPLIGGSIQNYEGEISVSLSTAYKTEDAMKSSMQAFASVYGGKYSDAPAMVSDVKYKDMDVSLFSSQSTGGLYPISLAIYFSQ